MEELPWDGVTDDDIQIAGEQFRGELQQKVPLWSGTKVNGKPLMWYAQRGIDVPRPVKAVVIEELELWREVGGGREVGFRAVASKGASMRVLAHELGKVLGCGAHLGALRREAVGQFTVEKAWVMDVFLPMAKKYRKGYRDFDSSKQR